MVAATWTSSRSTCRPTASSRPWSTCSTARPPPSCCSTSSSPSCPTRESPHGPMHEQPTCSASDWLGSTVHRLCLSLTGKLPSVCPCGRYDKVQEHAAAQGRWAGRPLRVSIYTLAGWALIVWYGLVLQVRAGPGHHGDREHAAGHHPRRPEVLPKVDAGRTRGLSFPPLDIYGALLVSIDDRIYVLLLH